jgi:hypothetical protein
MIGMENWAAFIDIDEFIVLKNHPTIKDLLNDYCVSDRVGCVGLNWKLFGNSHHLNYSSEGVLERFTFCERTPHKYAKSVCRLSSIKDFNTSVYYPVFINNKTVQYDMGGNKYEGRRTDHGYEYPAVIHHYYTKSREEFEWKMKRGSAFSNEPIDSSEMWWLRNVNEMKDKTAWIDFKNRNIIIGNISSPPEVIQSVLSEACYGIRHCNIADAANQM